MFCVCCCVSASKNRGENSFIQKFESLCWRRIIYTLVGPKEHHVICILLLYIITGFKKRLKKNTNMRFLH